MLSNENLVILYISGGLSDQILKYCFAKSIEFYYGKKIQFDLYWFNVDGMDNIRKHKRSFQLLEVFKDLDFEIATHEKINLSKECLVYGNNISNIDEILNNPKPIYLDGYCTEALISKKFELEELIHIFDMHKYIKPNLDTNNYKTLNEIQNNLSVAVHVRRGDYIYHLDVRNLKHIMPDVNYFYRAISLIKKMNTKKLRFYFFSNDIDYVKNNLIPYIKDIDYTIVSNNDSEHGYIDMYLISCCLYQIASVGSFAITANKLSRNKILITPSNIQYLENQLFTKTITNKFYPLLDNLKLGKPFIDNNSISFLLSLINSSTNNFLQITVNNGFEALAILKTGIACNENFNLYLLDSCIDTSISGISFNECSSEEKKHFNLFLGHIYSNIQKIYPEKLDLVFVADKAMHPFLLFYFIYLFPILNDDAVIVFNNSKTDTLFNGGNLFFECFSGFKEIVWDYKNNRVSNISYIKLNDKAKLLDIIKILSKAPFSSTLNDLFNNICKDYYSNINCENNMKISYILKTIEDMKCFLNTYYMQMML